MYFLRVCPSERSHDKGLNHGLVLTSSSGHINLDLIRHNLLPWASLKKTRRKKKPQNKTKQKKNFLSGKYVEMLPANCSFYVPDVDKAKQLSDGQSFWQFSVWNEAERKSL